MSDISRNIEVEIEVLTPLHIGNGIVLKRDYDFVTQRGTTYRLNQHSILNDFWPADERQQQLMLSKPPSDLIRDVDLSTKENQEKYTLYHYRGDPSMNEIREQIKNVFGKAYIPGSSLKGALRTLLMRTMIEAVDGKPVQRSDIGRPMRYAGDADAAKTADDFLDKKYAGSDANHSLFRGIAISDTQPTDALTVQNIHVVRDLIITAEAIPSRTKLRTSIRVDRHLMITNREHERLGFDRNYTGVITSFAKAANETVKTRVQQELQYHFRRNENSPATRFYATLKAELDEPEIHKRAFFLQVGFATGWRSKTLIGGRDDGDPLIEQVINEFNLDAGGKRRDAEPRQPGDPFPKARHLAFVNGAPALPMGWVRVKLLPA